jgi:23S rRNA (cytosine1962-C5)-methyltransferase
MAGKSITLKKHEDRRLTDGHLWVFSNEIAEITGEPAAADIVRVRIHGGKPLGSGFYNPHSLIACRILTTLDEEIDFEFFRRRISAALGLRRKLYHSAETFRIVHGESDYLPGLVIDKYNEYVTVQTFSAGMDTRLTLICDVLDSVLKPAGIVERNESPLRLLEGLELRKGVLRGSVAPTTVAEHGIKFLVDPAQGQKTGFFLDQRENRKAFRRYAKDADVLDCFCNEGGFALNAAAAGAKSVTGVDVSAGTVERAAANAALNGLAASVNFVEMDAFDFLKEAAASGKSWDAINLDPPSFAKNRKSVPAAKKGYAGINAAAMRLLRPGGILATSSCSHHIQDDTFLEILKRAAKDAGKRVSLLEWRGAAPDHPVHPSMPETRYLKFAVLSVE